MYTFSQRESETRKMLKSKKRYYDDEYKKKKQCMLSERDDTNSYKSTRMNDKRSLLMKPSSELLINLVSLISGTIIYDLQSKRNSFGPCIQIPMHWVSLICIPNHHPLLISINFCANRLCRYDGETGATGY